MSDLASIIRAIIRAKGPINLADYMELALQHPEFGYYKMQNPVGVAGDFITAPEISQMFGEMIGLWCADGWRAMGSPERFTLLELGPGRGTLLQDALRATAKIKGFHAALEVHLLESNQVLRQAQQEKLGVYMPVYIDDVAALPPQPLIVIANEFFDALPIRQFVKTDAGWCERLVGCDNDGALALTLSPPGTGMSMLIPESVREAAVGTVHEVSLPALSLMRTLAKHITTHGGAALIVDYGYAASAGQATLQAVTEHRVTDIFDQPGQVDLTAHVDFGALGMVATAQGLVRYGPVTQGMFLEAMGIGLWAMQLKRGADDAQVAAIDAALARLTDAAQMGQLFKAMALTQVSLTQPAGF